MWNNRNSESFLVGMQNGTATWKEFGGFLESKLSLAIVPLDIYSS